MEAKQEPQFEVTVTAQRSLSNFELAGDDDLCWISPQMIIAVPNFMWWQLTTKHTLYWIKAIRKHPDQREDGRWDPPIAFRVKKPGERQALTLSPKEIFGPKGINPYTDWLLEVMQRPDFVALTYKVGRRVQRIAPLPKESDEGEDGLLPPEYDEEDKTLDAQELVDEGIAGDPQALYADADNWKVVEREQMETGE